MLRNLAEMGSQPATANTRTNPPLAASSFQGGVISDGLSSTGSSHVTTNANANGTEVSSSSMDD